MHSLPRIDKEQNQQWDESGNGNLTTETIPHDVLMAGEDVVLFYLYLRYEKGNGERLSTLLALRSPPRIMTDDVAMQGVPTIADRYEQDPEGTKRLVRKAAKLGYKVKDTDWYNEGIALEEGDPPAFINHGQCRGHIVRTIQKRQDGPDGGPGADGLVKVKSQEPDYDPWERRQHALNPRIVERKYRQHLRQNPDLAAKDPAEIKEAIVDKHASKE